MIAAETIRLLRGESAPAEAGGQLTPAQLAIVHNQRWFKLFVPKAYGGLALTFPEAVRLEEELAAIDGSLGWTITLCAGANFFVGYIDPRIAAPIFSTPDVCLGGSGQASGRAVVERNGYRVSGTWHYATGAPHLTHFTANCIIEKDGKTLLDQAGNPVVQSFFFHRKDIRMLEDWRVFGLKATASHSFEVTDLWVDETQSFIIAPDRATLTQPIYRYPFLQFAEATLAANTLGMARHFVACARGLVKDPMIGLVEQAGQELSATRTSFLEAVDRSWDELVSAGQASADVLHEVSELSQALAHRCRQMVTQLYPHAGLAAADTATEINRIWRDLFTASQHSLLR